MTRLTRCEACGLAALALAIAAPALADVRVTDATYVRHDGATDAVIANCSDDSPGSNSGGNRQQNEPAVAVHPGEPRFVAAAANDDCTVPSFADGWEGIYVSSNGGATFVNSLLPGYPGDTSAAGQASPLFGPATAVSDPLLSWDEAGNLFVGGIGFNRTATTGNIQPANGNSFVATYARDARSPLGIAYLRTVVVGPGTPSPFTPGSGRFSDKPSLRVDNGATSPNRGNVYFAWTLFPGGNGTDQIAFARSTDHGQTFSKPITLSKGAARSQGSAIAVTSSGAVLVFWRQFDSVANGIHSAIVFAASSDGGLTFTDPAIVALTEGYDREDVTTGGSFAGDCGSGPFQCLSGFTFHRTGAFPQAVGDKHGNVFVTWEETTPAPDNGDTYRPDGQSQVVLVRSSNNGASWSATAKIDPEPVGHQWWPNIAYDTTKDTLAVVYFDSRTDPSYSPFRPPGNNADGTSVCGVPASASCNVLNAFVATSANQGASWSPTRASSVGHQPEYEMFGGRQIPFHGDYLGIDAASGVVF